MPINLLIATAQNIKPTVLTIIVKIILHRYTLKTTAIYPQKNEYSLVVNKTHKLLKFETNLVKLSLQLSAFETIKNKIATERELQKLYLEQQPYQWHLKTYNYLASQNNLKSSLSLLHLAKVNFEDKIVETLIARLNRPSLIQEIIHHQVDAGNTFAINIISSFEISAEKRMNLAATIEKRISKKAELQFTFKKNTKSLIELDTDSFKIYWNLKHYLIEVKLAPKKELNNYTNARKRRSPLLREA